ncbi:MAG TPA: preprotein translocase subunit SecA [Candidatus Paceibacterota bacterium]
MSLLTKIFGDGSGRAVRRYLARAKEIGALEPAVRALDEASLRGKTAELRSRLAGGAPLDALLPEAFACVREAARRTLGERHYDVQLAGGVALHEGNVTEMRTGEGKTLVATLPVYLNALPGEGVHVVTVNDYLARRDAAWMGQVYHALGLSVGVIGHDGAHRYDPTYTTAADDQARDAAGDFRVAHEYLKPCTRREAYEADITYGTNSEFGFDYLRDSVEYRAADLRQRGHAYAVVDEVDSILIDEARTPLIISGPAAEPESLYRTFAEMARGFAEGEDYEVDLKHNSVAVLASAIEKAERTLAAGSLYTERGAKLVLHLENAIKAKALYLRDKQYVVRNGEVVIVDEFTGRMQPGRRWSKGIHQAVEAKEGVAIGRESRTYATVTYQHYFKLYRKLAGMTGTAETSAEEFLKVYGLETIVVPTHRPSARLDRPDLVFRTEAGKWQAAARKIKEVQATGRPVLVGTASIEKNETLSALLKAEGVAHEMLNAKNHEREAEIIAAAGREGTVTVATNMAGRGVDIKLGGVPYDSEKRSAVAAQGGLFVLGTERHDARRIDNQLRGRSGRQGDPGETQFFVSLEDDLMKRFASPAIGAIMARASIPEDQPLESRMVSKAIASAQSRIEGSNFDARKSLLDYDSVMNTQRQSVYGRRRNLLLAAPEVALSLVDDLVGGAPPEAAEAARAAVRRLAEAVGEPAAAEAARQAALRAIDRGWIDHLELMDYARSSTSLRGWGQRDPLVEYQKEGRSLFDEMSALVAAGAAGMISRLDAKQRSAADEAAARTVDAARAAVAAAAGADAGSGSRKIGRNEAVTIEKDGARQTLKWKRAERLLAEGWKLTN